MARSAICRLLGSKKVPLAWCIIVPTVVTLCGIGAVIWWFPSNPISVLDTTIVPDHGEFSLGQNHDAEFGYNLWVKVGNSEWESAGWSLDGGRRTITASSADGQFHGIVAEGFCRSPQAGLDRSPIIVILDSQTGIAWPTSSSAKTSRSFWMKAWQELKQAEPRFPEPPA